MTRLTIDLPDGLHKVLKSISVINGTPMKDMAISAIEDYTQTVVNKSEFVTEEEADKLLHPLLTKYANQIKDGDFKGRFWEEVEEEI